VCFPVWATLHPHVLKVILPRHVSAWKGSLSGWKYKIRNNSKVKKNKVQNRRNKKDMLLEDSSLLKRVTFHGNLNFVV